MSWPIEAAQQQFKKSDPALYQLTQLMEFVYAGNDELLDKSVFYNVATAIVYQSISIHAANAVHGRLMGLYGNKLSPEKILQTADETLREIGLPYRKIAYLQDLAQRVLAGLPTTEALELLDDQQITRILTEVKGVGPWTAQMFLMFTLQRPDVLPTNDVGLQIAAGKLYGLERKMSVQELAARGEMWRPYRTIAALYLWQSRGEKHVELLE
ncbi:MAG: DNA-3-methyladenine glycosylase 2 family protein [Limnothrix sp. RL_2_0]|nr:DNA-3-methyladenine glycosylase 2 family protein [Limnothrix sp. RL_2_0]